ncbi:DNA topoisomerase-1 [Mycoplasmopsis mustelae]|uniref:DNA topoisomerase 1 n=1 Tax=Mycoplasmopsis mustelae TaxID=171289 RepID=A0A4R7UDG0_9BACT|nr:type I DNA topoisomerase [Mycoplasmopsis mustelae]TDV24076.1 DNA topoisomerase-1 [Mycoplasmopsis mustelae]
MKNLVIVESPNKVKTIQKYLGDDFKVVASVGHFLKMKTDGVYGLGIDFETWEPKYSLDSTKKNIVKEIKELTKNSEHIYIATDPDREGEAIGSHLVTYFKLNDKYSRIKYNEISEEAILNALKKASPLDENLVNAQKSRRMLDRIIGFRVTNLIKNKFKNSPGLPTAGRVQSVALKLIVDREKEIEAFVPEDFYKLNALDAKGQVLANYFNTKNPEDKREWVLKDEYPEMFKYFQTSKKELKVVDIKISKRKMSAITPFKQSVLYKRSPYSAASTQIIIQKLYEGFGDGGLISYPRTDSTRMSEGFIKKTQAFIKDKYGSNYVAENVKGVSGDQDAHEAIRITNFNLTPQLAKTTYPEMTDRELAIYTLIYNNTFQSLIAQPIRESTLFTFQNGDYLFRKSFSRVLFDGYYIINKETEDEVNPNYKLGDVIPVDKFEFLEYQTQPEPRYNDGSLIEKLDEIKVGRPSTFASTVNIIKNRGFVVPDKSPLIPTDFGKKVSKALNDSFSEIFNEKYTAYVEEQLDKIAEHQLQKDSVMQEFWQNFELKIKDASNHMEVVVFKLHELQRPCPNCGGVLVIRSNKKGQKFIGCKSFPTCRHLESCNDTECQAENSINNQIEEEFTE